MNLVQQLVEGLPVYSQSNSEGLAKQTQELIMIDKYENIPTIKCPTEIQKSLKFVGFKGLSDFVTQYTI
jgi:hypothetical protein|tara:strand:- start:637 stop:843 length:207 start_codon:yes stop_codon:yes gene_type:complete